MTEHDINDCKKYGRHCKICFGEKSETVLLMLFNSRNKDKRTGLYDKDKFITKQYIIKLVIDSYDLCYYCNNHIQYKHKNFTLATLDRINDNYGHNINNVVISCLFCNLHKTRLNGHIEYQHRHKYYQLYTFLKDNYLIH